MTQEQLIRLIAERIKDKHVSQELQEVAEQIDINPGDLDTAMSHQPGLHAYVAVGAETWLADADECRFNRKVWEAAYTKQIRNRRTPKGMKPLTEAGIDAELRTNEDWQAMRSAELEMRAVAGVFRAMTSSFLDRKDMLVSLGANMRAQMAAEGLSINEAHTRHQVSATRRRAADTPQPRNSRGAVRTN